MVKTQHDLVQAIESARRLVSVGEEYVHYKDTEKRYIVEDIATNVDTNEPCVIYRALYGERLLFVRSLTEWMDGVEKNGEKMPRFRLCRD